MRWLVPALSLLLVLGCKPTVPTGNGGSMTIEDADNGEVTIRTDDGSTIQTEKDGDKMTITDGQGNVTATIGGEIDEAKLGVKIYPGAKQMEGGVTSTKDGVTSTVVTYQTGDSVAQVGEFYKKELAGAQSVAGTTNGDEMHSLTLEEPKRRVSLHISRAKADAQTTILITSEIKP